MSHSERCLCPNCGGPSVDGDLCADCRRASDESVSYRAGYEAGLRRAQELAKEHLDVDYIEVFADFNQAIDAEVSKR